MPGRSVDLRGQFNGLRLAAQLGSLFTELWADELLVGGSIHFRADQIPAIVDAFPRIVSDPEDRQKILLRLRDIYRADGLEMETADGRTTGVDLISALRRAQEAGAG